MRVSAEMATAVVVALAKRDFPIPAHVMMELNAHGVGPQALVAAAEFIDTYEIANIMLDLAEADPETFNDVLMGELGLDEVIDIPEDSYPFNFS